MDSPKSDFMNKTMCACVCVWACTGEAPDSADVLSVWLGK